MEKYNDILKRYYRGETTVKEEQLLREAYRKGELPNDPVLSDSNNTILPNGLTEQIQYELSKRKHTDLRRYYIITSAIAAIVVLIIMIRAFHPDYQKNDLQLSDNLKIERFEEALRVIGNVLEEKSATQTTNQQIIVQKNRQATHKKILYEDKDMIITIE